MRLGDGENFHYALFHFMYISANLNPSLKRGIFFLLVITRKKVCVQLLTTKKNSAYRKSVYKKHLKPFEVFVVLQTLNV